MATKYVTLQNAAGDTLYPETGVTVGDGLERTAPTGGEIKIKLARSNWAGGLQFDNGALKVYLGTEPKKSGLTVNNNGALIINLGTTTGAAGIELGTSEGGAYGLKVKVKENSAIYLSTTTGKEGLDIALGTGLTTTSGKLTVKLDGGLKFSPSGNGGIVVNLDDTKGLNLDAGGKFGIKLGTNRGLEFDSGGFLGIKLGTGLQFDETTGAIYVV